jgi:hypothetical protein
MRLRLLWICGLVGACTTGPVTVPDDPILTEVPLSGSASTAGGDGFTSTIEGALATDGSGTPANVTVAGSTTGTGRALDDDTINLMQWTLEQQKIDAAIAERDLATARSQLVVVQPGPLPSRPEGVNIALFANQTTNAVGQSIYPRSVGARVGGVGNCGRFRDADAAQRAFLSGGGPERDRYGIDPDGDGFACKWDPAPYRALR